MENEKTFTWADLKEFANSLTEEQLKKPVRYWSEDTAGKISGAWDLEEDYYKDPEDDQCSCIQESEWSTVYLEYDITKAQLAYPKGTPMLQTEF